MKNIFCLLLVSCLGLIACRNDEANRLQQIDQVIRIYVKDANGKDLLNNNLKGTYTFTAYDLGGIRDKTQISKISGPKTDQDTIRFIEYIDGATRVLKDSISPELKNYESVIAFEFTKKVNDTISQSILDTMRVNYRWTPQIFQVSSIFWNKNKVFTKVEGQPNTIVIVK